MVSLMVLSVVLGKMLSCASSGPAGYNECHAGGRITTAHLTQEVSLSPGTCVPGRTWGWYNDVLWVRGGCSGQFDVDTVPDGQLPAVVACASSGTAETQCPVGFGIGSAQLQQQASYVPCVEGQTWGFDANDLWVSGGCSGTFVVYPVGSTALY